FLRREPAAPLHQVALHHADQRDRPAEAGRAEPEEVARQPGDHRRANEAYKSSMAAAPRTRRSSSLGCAAAIPCTRLATPPASGRPNFSSLQSTSCTISAMRPSAGSVRAKRASSVSKLQRSPSWVYSPP